MAQKAPVWVGVLEKSNFVDVMQDPYRESRRWKYRTNLRPLFVKVGAEWSLWEGSSIDLICFDAAGRRTKAHASGDSVFECCGMVSGLHRVENSPGKLTAFPHPERVFEQNDILAYRLVASNTPARSRPLRRSMISATEERTLEDSIRARTGRYLINEAMYPQSPDPVMLQLWLLQVPAFSDSGIVVKRVLADSEGYRLLALQIRPAPDAFVASALSPFHRREDNGTLIRAFAVIGADTSVRLIFADMTLLAHADLDGDGSEEYLFFHSQFNHYGYLLAYDGFRKWAHYSWSYH